jgi:hypothetical protein
MFVSRYLFFWAREHKEAALASGVAPAATHTRGKPTTRLNAPTGSVLGDVVAQGSLFLQHAISAAVTVYKAYIHPAVWWFLSWEARLVMHAATTVLGAGYGVWLYLLAPFVFDSALPTAQGIYTERVVPWYAHNLQASLDPVIGSAAGVWETHLSPWYERNLLDYVDYAIGRVHYVAYFTMRFFFDGELENNLERVLTFAVGFVPGVIEQLTALPALQVQLGEHCEAVVTALVYAVVALFLYIIRRFIFGVLALMLTIVLAPVLLTVYCVAKLVHWLMPKKKTVKKVSTKVQAGLVRSGSKTTASSGFTSTAAAPAGTVRSVTSAAGPPVSSGGSAAPARSVSRGSRLGVAEAAEQNGAVQQRRNQRGVQFDQPPTDNWGGYEP